MNTFELNKIIGALLGTLLFVMGVGFVAEAIYRPIEGRGPGYALPEPAAEGELVAETEETEVPAVELTALLASANAEQGAAAARKCQACHNFGEGEANKLGPALYDVVGRTIGAHEGYAYSDAMQAHATAGDVWTYEFLDEFLAAPKAAVPGTKMGFAGVAKPEERANILAYLATLSSDPTPLPQADATAAKEAASADAQPDATAETPGSETPAAASSEGPAAPQAETPAAAGQPTLGALLANASAERGQKGAAICKACHGLGEGDPNKVGPTLYDVVGQVIGGHEGFAYSADLVAHKEAGDTWTYENLDTFLAAPKDFAPGTKMGFAGVKDAGKRADLLAYLATLSANPVPFPPAAGTGATPAGQ